MAGESSASHQHETAPGAQQPVVIAGGKRKVVWLRRMLQRWRSAAAARRSSSSSGSSGGAPADVPRGCCAVYVGAERRRFVVPTAYLGMPVFRRLLQKAEEEFGYDYVGGALTIPCEADAFEYILVLMDRHQKGLVDDEGNPREGQFENRDLSSDRR